jgi:hypothetical protein
MKKLSFAEMVQKLQKRFENIEVLDYIECNKNYKLNFSIWIKKAYCIPYTKKDTNTILLNGYQNNQKLYELDVYKKFDKFCQRYGWYASTENYTLQLFKI